MKNTTIKKIKRTNLMVFIKAYLFSYLITVILFLFRRPLVFLYQIILDNNLTYQYTEIFLISKTEVMMALLSPLALPITGMIISRWLPQYLILPILYFLIFFTIYKLSEFIVKRKFLIVLMLLLASNLAGIYFSISVATSI